MQTVDAPSEPEQATSPRRVPRTAVWIAAAVVVALVAAPFVLRAVRPGVLPNVTLAGIDVGDMSRDELTDAVGALADERETDIIIVELDGRSRSSTNATVGYAVDRDATVDAAWRLGRGSNPFASLADHARATFAAIAIEPVVDVDEQTLDSWTATVQDVLTTPPREGTVALEGASVVSRNPEPGRRPTSDSLDTEAREAFDQPGPDTLDIATEPVDAQTTTADITALTRTARQIVSQPIVLRRGKEELRLSPKTIGDLHRTVRQQEDGGVQLDLIVARGRVRDLLDDRARSRFDVDPRDATVVLQGGKPKLRKGKDGFALDVQGVTDQIGELARNGSVEQRTAAIAGETVEPDRTNAEARELKITQRVSSFTTNHACCQGRVTNIHRFADLVDGVVIDPGETFSLNGHVGQRTAAKGFVGGGAIQQGEYVEELGGGVSQFATTFFNAAFFGGYEILDYKAHSYYISRYPVGRESTINWPTVDVEIRNDSPYGLLIDTSYTSTSITVTFYGRKWVKVDSTTGSPHNYTSPALQVEENPSLPKGTERVLQSGGNGFDIVVTRKLRYEDGTTKNEEYFTRYLAEPRIVERGTGGKNR